MPETRDSVTIDDVHAAGRRLGRLLAPTPTQISNAASETAGVPVLLKLEMFQPIRVFKLRGALNRLTRLHDEGYRGGVVTASAGNHGLAVAYSAQLYSLPATICVPAEANDAKVRAIRRCGAEVVQQGVDFQEALDYALALAQSRGDTFVHAYDDPDVIAGQGTIGLELSAIADRFDSVLLPIGGGGLLGGTALALKTLAPQVRIFGVAMSGADSMVRSLAAGHVVHLPHVHTIADGLSPRSPSERTLDLARRYVDDVVVIEDEDLFRALHLLLFEEHLVVEASGAAPLAALLRHGAARFGQRPALVLTGGNCSDGILRRVAAEM